MFKKLFSNTRKPNGVGGKFILWSMNVGHTTMAKWGLQYLSIQKTDQILDIGCGGGMNIARMLELAPKGSVYGLDYSELSVEKSCQVNQAAIAAGRSKILQGSVSEMPYQNAQFDIVTAFETVYFWPDFKNDVKEVARVLKPGGLFFICNEETRMDDEDVSHKGFVKMLDLKVYSPTDFKELLTEAGFENIQFHVAEKSKRMCVIAQKAVL